MQIAELFRGKPEQLVIKVNDIISGGRTIVQVVKLVAGHYMIIHQ